MRWDKLASTMPPKAAAGRTVSPNISLVPISIEENIRTGHSRAAGADALEYPMAMSLVLLTQIGVPPGVIDNNNSSRFDMLLGFLKADRPDLGPLLTAVHDNNIKFLLRHGVQVFGLFESCRVFEVEWTEFERGIADTLFLEPLRDPFIPLGVVFDGIDAGGALREK